MIGVIVFLKVGLSIVSINTTNRFIRRWRRMMPRSHFNSTSDTSNFSLSLFDAGTIRHISSNACDFNSSGLNIMALDDDFEVKESGDLNFGKRRINRRSMLLNRKNKNFLGEHL